MTDPTTPPTAPPGTPTLWRRFLGVLFDPRATFTALVADPRWVGMLLLATVTAAGTTAAFLATEVGRQAWLDEAVARAEAFGATVSDEQYARMARLADWAAAWSSAIVAVWVPLATVALAGVLFLVFTVGLGGGATFRQVLAVTAHAGAVRVVRDLFVLPLNFARESLSSTTNLAVFFPMLDEASFLGRFLGAIDLVTVWWLGLVALGLGVIYRRPARRIALGLFGAYGLFGVAVAGLLVVLGGS